MLIELKKEEVDILLKLSHVASTENGNSYFRLPYWFRKVNDNTIEIYSYEELTEMRSKTANIPRDLISYPLTEDECYKKPE